MKNVKVALGRRSYDILIGSNILPAVGDILSKTDIAKACYIITNSNIKSIYGNRLLNPLRKHGFHTKFRIVPDSEKSKSHAVWLSVLKDLSRFDKGKGTAVIALGGGVVGDLSGFVAATYRRGIPFIQIPTTLLAQVDSAIGGKVAIDIEYAKNIIGAFYQPKVVFSDISVLKSLPLREIRNGLAEVVKYGIILDKKFFYYIEKNIPKILKHNLHCLEYIVARSSMHKAGVVSADEHEKKGYRTILNFGHTIGHAIEAASSYKKSISHGEAVAVGMLCAFDIAVLLKLVDKTLAHRVGLLIKRIGLPTKIKGVAVKDVIRATRYDKKVIKGKARWVLPVDIGHAVVVNRVPPELIEKVIRDRIGT
jgi:3-dehydroquinate synthase